MEDIPEGEQVLTGTFSLNGHPIAILFDSGASHDFISKTCTEKHQLDVHHSSTPYLISTPGGKIATRHIARKIPLDLA
jgi:predicted aspartyl protease